MIEEQYEEIAKAMGVNPVTKQTVPFDCLNPKFLKEYFEILLQKVRHTFLYEAVRY